MECCVATRALVIDTLRAAECPTCRTVFLPPDDDVIASEPPAERPTLSLEEVLSDVGLALRWHREDATVCGPPSESPLARMQGYAAMASAASGGERQVGLLWGLITNPHTKVGRRARESFVASLLTYCERTSRPDPIDTDWTAARTLAGHLEALDPEHRQTLLLVARELTPTAPWEIAALLVAHVLAPRHLRDRWSLVHRAEGRGGRPRVDATEPPPEIAALEWGDARLSAAVLAWSAGRT